MGAAKVLVRLHKSANVSSLCYKYQNLVCWLMHSLTDDVSLSMKLWCHKQCVVCTIHAGKQNEAFHHLEQVILPH